MTSFCKSARCLVFLVWLCGQPLPAQNLITTFAGSPKTFFSRTPLPAKTVPVAPSRIAVGPKGEVYFGDREANVVWRLNVDGTLVVAAGNGLVGFSGDGGAATSASLNQPAGVAVDREGNIFIADVRNDRVRKVDKNGIISTAAGNGKPGYPGDGGPAAAAEIGFSGALTLSTNGHTPTNYAGSIAVDNGGNLYIADGKYRVIRKVNPAGIITTIAAGGASGGLAVSSSDAIAVDQAGNVYVGSSSLALVQKIDSAGIVTSLGTHVNHGAVTSLAIDTGGKLYASTLSGEIIQITGNGNQTVVAGGGDELGDGGPATSALLIAPFGVAVDLQGNIFVADDFDERVRRVDPSGIITTVAGSGSPNYFGDGAPATTAGLSAPNSIAFDTKGNVFIADTNNGRIRVVDSKGIITTLASGLTDPSYVALAADGSIYVDGAPGIVKIATGGAVTIVAGGGNSPLTDGIQARDARIPRVLGLASDASGNLYFLDGSLFLRKISSSGVLSSPVAGLKASCGANLHQCLATDPLGNVYVPGGGGVQRISPSGTATTIKVSGVSQISGIAADSAGNLYVSDTGSHDQILKVDPSGITSPYAGNNGYGFGGDGGPALLATLFGPTGLAVDASGNLFIADNLNGRIRIVLAAPASYTVSPTTLNFSANRGGAAPAIQSIALSSTVPGLPFTAASDAGWLQVSPSPSTMPGLLQVSVNAASLAPGNYKGTITIVAAGASPATSTVSVSLTAGADEGQPKLSTDLRTIDFSGLQGAGNQSAQLRVSNIGSGSLSFRAIATSSSGGFGLTVSPATGTATPSAPVSLTVTAPIGSLGPGTYKGTVAIIGGSELFILPVTLSVSAQNRVILVSQTALSFTAVAQGGVPLPQSFGILNTGQGSMSWSAKAETLSGGSSWLQATPLSGNVERPYIDVSTVNVAVDASGLAPGDYYGRIQVSAAAANSPQVMTVILTVLPPGSNPGPEVRPVGLIFTGLPGVTPGSQDVLVGNPKAQMDTYLSGSIGRGFTYLPANANVRPDQPTTPRVFPDFSSLSAGTIERGTITLQFGDGTPRTIGVLNVVAPSGPGAANKGGIREDTGCPNMVLQIQHRSLRANFVAVLGQPTTVEVQVADSCGTLVGPDRRTSPNVSASFSNRDDGIKLTHIGNGIWTGTWRPVNATQGAVRLVVTAFLIDGTVTQANQVELTGTIGTGRATPTVTAGGVVQAASFTGGAPIAPGSLITIYGSNLADTTTTAPRLPLPQEQNGTQVLLGDQTLPLLYTSAGQMNVQVPFEVPVNTQYQMTVQRGAVLSVPEALVVAAAQPGIFTKNQQGTGQGIIVKSDQVTLAEAGTPARVGETIVIYCTGLGGVTPATAAGAAAGSNPLAATRNTVAVRIDGKAAQVSFSGLTPGSAGLYQVNAVVPGGVTPGDAVPVVLEVAGQVSPDGVTMAVR